MSAGGRPDRVTEKISGYEILARATFTCTPTPDDALTRFQYSAPQVGCFNGCTMCSQIAGRDTWGLTKDGLTGLLTTLAQAAAERNLTIASGRIHRPGVVFPYADGPYGAADPDSTATAPSPPCTSARPPTSARSPGTPTPPGTCSTCSSPTSRPRPGPEAFTAATGADIDGVLDALTARAEELEPVATAVAPHLREQFHPPGRRIRGDLERAGYPPTLFFFRTCTIDTGQIVNQGRTENPFRGLAATPVPLTPTGRLPIAVAGKKNQATTTPSHLVEELEPCHLSGDACHRLPAAPPCLAPARRMDRAA